MTATTGRMNEGSMGISRREKRKPPVTTRAVSSLTGSPQQAARRSQCLHLLYACQHPATRPGGRFGQIPDFGEGFSRGIGSFLDQASEFERGQIHFTNR